jgi:AcrR family transcriptional regulator
MSNPEDAVNADAPKREYLDATRRRQSLLDAAVDVMLDDGVEALSLRSVAQRAGVAHRLVSYAFGSKGALVSALLERESERTIARVWSSPMIAASLPDALRTALQAFLDEVRADPRRFECMAALTATARLSPELADAARAEAEADRQEIADRVAQWGERGGVLETDTDDVVAAIQAAANGLAAWWLATRDDERAPRVVAMLAAGIAS